MTEFLLLVGFITVVIIAVILIFHYRNNKTDNTTTRREIIFENNIIEDYTQIQENDNSNYFPYHKKHLLTKNEYYFYKRLKELTDSANLQILAKVRLADLIEVNQGLTSSEWNRYFSKIKSKHIDFVIVQEMRIIMLIELDDNSHNSSNRQARDTFVENALSSAGHLFVRTYGDTKIVEKELYKLRIIPGISNN